MNKVLKRKKGDIRYAKRVTSTTFLLTHWGISKFHNPMKIYIIFEKYKKTLRFLKLIMGLELK